MTSRRIVVVGASAGGVEGLMSLARTLPADLPAAVFMVLHVPAYASSVLPQLLNRAQGLHADHAIEGEPIQNGRIYVAPPDHHLLMNAACVQLGRGPSENGHRPAIDPLFRAAARWHGSSVIGVVLSGSLDDGTAGLMAIKMSGGLCLVQDPTDALYPSMPKSALEHVEIDHVAPLAELGALITRLVAEPVVSPASATRPELDALGAEALVAADTATMIGQHGVPSSFACPDCHGVLWEINDGELTRFRCRVGHGYLGQSLYAAMSERVEEALWIALRALKESSALLTRMAERASHRKVSSLAAVYEQRAHDANARARVIEDALRGGPNDRDSRTVSAGTSRIAPHEI